MATLNITLNHIHSTSGIHSERDQQRMDLPHAESLSAELQINCAFGPSLMSRCCAVSDSMSSKQCWTLLTSWSTSSFLTSGTTLRSARRHTCDVTIEAAGGMTAYQGLSTWRELDFYCPAGDSQTVAGRKPPCNDPVDWFRALLLICCSTTTPSDCVQRVMANAGATLRSADDNSYTTA